MWKSRLSSSVEDVMLAAVSQTWYYVKKLDLSGWVYEWIKLGNNLIPWFLCDSLNKIFLFNSVVKVGITAHKIPVHQKLCDSSNILCETVSEIFQFVAPWCKVMALLKWLQNDRHGSNDVTMVLVVILVSLSEIYKVRLQLFWWLNWELGPHLAWQHSEQLYFHLAMIVK